MRSHRSDPNEAVFELGAEVRRRRKLGRLGQEDLAALAGCSALFVRELERGKSTVRLDKVLAVITVLGMEFFLQPGQSGIRVSDVD